VSVVVLGAAAAVSTFAQEPALLKIEELGAVKLPDASSCSGGNAVCAADLRSTLRITPNLSAVPSGEATVTSLAPPSHDEAELRRLLDEALVAFTRSMEASAAILKALSDAGGEPVPAERARALSDAFESQRKALLAALRRLVTLAPTVFGLGARPSSDQVFDALDAAYRDPQRTGEWIRDVITKVDAQAADRAKAVKEQARTLTVRLGARCLHKGAAAVPLHLDGYDSFEPLAYTSRDAISTELTDAQKKRLKEEGAANAAIVARLRDVRNQLENLTSQAQDLKKSLHELVDAVAVQLESSRRQPLAQLLAELARIKQQAPQSDGSSCDEVGKVAAALEASLNNIQSAYTALERVVAELRRQLEQPDSAMADRPDLVLIGILDTFKLLGDAGTSLRDTVSSEAGRLPDEFKRLADAVKACPKVALPESVATEFNKTKQEVDDLLAPWQKLIQAVGDARGKSGDARDAAVAAGTALAAQLADPHVFQVPASEVRPTDLVLRRSGAEPGDTIEVMVRVADAKLGASYSATRIVETYFFGWSSDVSTGIVFVKSVHSDLANFEPAPTAGWIVSFRSRPGSGNFLGYVRPGVGFHAVTLYFDKDKPVEVGAGVSLHFLGDLLQFGYGWNLTVQSNRQYWYVGLGLFSLLNQGK
jgi:hypothetical protein